MAMLEMGQGVLEISQYLIYHNNHNHIHINGTRERSVGDGEVRGDACFRCSGFHKKINIFTAILKTCTDSHNIYYCCFEHIFKCDLILAS